MESTFLHGFYLRNNRYPKAFIRSHDSWIASFECSRYDFHLDESGSRPYTRRTYSFPFSLWGNERIVFGWDNYLMESFLPDCIELHPKFFDYCSVYRTYNAKAIIMEDVLIESR